mmetsp:Transcript_1956/g.6473  ORF Transcript_1956/g.6473 Transcript_1956/m.6473 type:complete len:202 (+) Transcript_1956:231-836(+)
MHGRRPDLAATHLHGQPGARWGWVGDSLRARPPQPVQKAATARSPDHIRGTPASCHEPRHRPRDTGGTTCNPCTGCSGCHGRRLAPSVPLRGAGAAPRDPRPPPHRRTRSRCRRRPRGPARRRAPAPSWRRAWPAPPRGAPRCAPGRGPTCVRPPQWHRAPGPSRGTGPCPGAGWRRWRSRPWAGTRGGAPGCAGAGTWRT